MSLADRIRGGYATSQVSELTIRATPINTTCATCGERVTSADVLAMNELGHWLHYACFLEFQP